MGRDENRQKECFRLTEYFSPSNDSPLLCACVIFKIIAFRAYHFNRNRCERGMKPLKWKKGFEKSLL